MEVLKNLENGIVILTVNRESALNALNKNVMAMLDEYLSEIEADQNKYKGVIITGSGQKAFVAGADITEFVGLNSNEGKMLSILGQNLFSRIEKLSIPVIAVVNGFALGGGCELAMACHMRIASNTAKFGQPEVNLGLIPGYAGTQRLVRYVGKAKAIELILTGEMVNAQEAYQLGLVNHLVEPGQEMLKAIEIIEKISKKGPKAISAALQSILAYYEFEGKGAGIESELFGELIAGSEAKEGIAAFLEKRKPEFSRQNKPD
ncbi:MAG: enoyl-CoA hydratase/isomerase family protein [Saprospiraceae bacterium]|nr:enoyl-CoA hydratase/isomerase family protein [Saprospiraceae bacterium]